jgi:hypothetical protein
VIDAGRRGAAALGALPCAPDVGLCWREELPGSAGGLPEEFDRNTGPFALGFRLGFGKSIGKCAKGDSATVGKLAPMPVSSSSSLEVL